MTATNHALTGTVIGLVIGEPLLALPLAFMSHFVCDALPHYGSVERDNIIRSKGFRNYLLLETSLCFLIVLSLAYFHPLHWQLGAICAFLAASPDLYWIKRYKTVLQHKKWKPDLFDKFAHEVQWFQQPKRYNAPLGVFVEIAWFVMTLLLILPALALAKI